MCAVSGGVLFCVTPTWDEAGGFTPRGLAITDWWDTYDREAQRRYRQRQRARATLGGWRRPSGRAHAGEGQPDPFAFRGDERDAPADPRARGWATRS